jgi:hypothetical protein
LLAPERPSGDGCPGTELHGQADSGSCQWLGQPSAYPGISNSYSLPAAFVNESDSTLLKRCGHCRNDLFGNLTALFLKIDHGRQSQTGRMGKLRLGKAQESTSSSTLGWGHFQHFLLTGKSAFGINIFC